MGQLVEFIYGGRSLVGEVFIETGTYLGETLENAVHAGFKTLHSIEFNERLHAIAANRFRDHQNVTVHRGSSPEILPHCIDRSRSTTFWLDAHYQGGPVDEQDTKYGQCPLLAELEVVFAEPWLVQPVVLIDDAKMFAGPVPLSFDKEQWPTLAQIRAKVPERYSLSLDYKMTEQWDDIILCLYS